MYDSLLPHFISLMLTGVPSGEHQFSPAIVQHMQQEFQARKKDSSELDIEAQNVKTAVKETETQTIVTCTADFVWGFHYQGAFWGVPGVEETRHERGVTEHGGQFVFTIDKATNTVVFVKENIAGNNYGEKPKSTRLFSKLFG